MFVFNYLLNMIPPVPSLKGKRQIVSGIIIQGLRDKLRSEKSSGQLLLRRSVNFKQRDTLSNL